MTTEQRLDNIDSRIDRLVMAVENLLSGISQISENVRINRLDLTELKVTTQRQAEAAQRQAEAVENVTAGMAQVSEDVRINRLDLTELKATTQGQAETARGQAETVDRLAKIVETLIARDG